MSRHESTVALADLRTELAAALSRSTKELTAQKTADMSAAERGRWTRQVLAMMKILDKSAGDPADSPKPAPSPSARRKRTAGSSHQPAPPRVEGERMNAEREVSPPAEQPRFRLRSLSEYDQANLARELQSLKDRTASDPFAPRSRTPIRRDDQAIDRLLASSP
jgi:hypothetical protein